MQSVYSAQVRQCLHTISGCAFISAEYFCPGGKSAAYLAVCQQGSAFVCASGCEVLLMAGMYAVVQGDDGFTIAPGRGGRVLLLPVESKMAAEMDTALPLSREGMRILAALSGELLQRKAGYCAVAAGLVTRLLDETVAKPGGRGDFRQTPLSVGDIRAYIASDCADASLSSVAAHFYYHPNTLSRFVRRACGISFTDLAREVKLERASGLLRETSLPVYRVAELCGYHNMTHFYNLFFNMYHKTPDQYRRGGGS